MNVAQENSGKPPTLIAFRQHNKLLGQIFQHRHSKSDSYVNWHVSATAQQQLAAGIPCEYWRPSHKHRTAILQESYFSFNSGGWIGYHKITQWLVLKKLDDHLGPNPCC